MKGSGFFDVEDKTLIIACAGNLTVRGDVGSSIRFVTDSGADDHYDAATGRFVSHGNAALTVPHVISIVIEQVDGNAQIKGLDGTMVIDAPVGGNLTVSTVNGGITLHGVGGNLNVKHANGQLVNSGSVGGDLNATHVGDLTLNDVGGNANLKHLNGDVMIDSVGGNASVRHMNGDVTIEMVEGDCVLSHIGGAINVKSGDDIRLTGPLSAEKHYVMAHSRIDFYYQSAQPLTVTAQAPHIITRMNFEKIVEEGGTLFGSIGSDGAVVNLTAGDRITLRGRGEGAGGWETFADFEMEFNENFDFSELNVLGEQISAEVNARMEEISRRLTPEVNQYAERAIRKAKEAVDRVVERMEHELTRAENQASRHAKQAARHAEKAAQNPRYRPTPPVPPTPPAPPRADTSAAQLKILKMLEDGKITVEQANELLAALE
jgi:hypothetical protein